MKEYLLLKLDHKIYHVILGSISITESRSFDFSYMATGIFHNLHMNKIR